MSDRHAERAGGGCSARSIAGKNLTQSHRLQVELLIYTSWEPGPVSTLQTSVLLLSWPGQEALLSALHTVSTFLEAVVICISYWSKTQRFGNNKLAKRFLYSTLGTSTALFMAQLIETQAASTHLICWDMARGPSLLLQSLIMCAQWKSTLS